VCVCVCVRMYVCLMCIMHMHSYTYVYTIIVYVRVLYGIYICLYYAYLYSVYLTGCGRDCSYQVMKRFVDKSGSIVGILQTDVDSLSTDECFI